MFRTTAWTALRLCLVLWSFGYFLVLIAAVVQNRPGVLLYVVPLLPLGVAQSMGVAWLLDRDDRHPLLKWSAVAAAILAASIIQTVADFLVLRGLTLTFFPEWQSWALNTRPPRVATIYILYVWTFGLAAALIWSARTGETAKLNEARAMAFEAAAARAEAAALRLQLNPHFLFNTLNGIASLVVRRKTAEAEEMIGRLADFMRASLVADPSALAPLRQELATVKSYLHIEQARLEDRMHLTYAVEDAALDVLVPNFLLQPLIENAVKHGVTRHGVTIEVGAKIEKEALILWVHNSPIGSGRQGSSGGASRNDPPPGIGLSNTRRRLHSVYGDRAWMKAAPAGEGYRCEIGLPAAALRAAAE